MFGLLILILTVAGLWFTFTPTLRFSRRFARLIDSPKTRTSFNPFAPATSVSGWYNERRVELRLEQPLENSLGRVVVKMQVRARDGAPWKDAAVTATNPEVSRATFDLEGRYELALMLRGGWLQAGQIPFDGLFPGRFEEGRWRQTLAQMAVLADWLEATNAS